MRTHVRRSIEALEHIGLSEQAMEPVVMHHERNDGSGYPRGLKGDEITQVGKMSAVVDVYDAHCASTRRRGSRRWR